MNEWIQYPRFVGSLLFFPCITVLLVALNLEPAAEGIGTHQQLGLSPCTFWLLLQTPCPMCGMTTTFTHLAHLQFSEGLLNQPFGVVLFGLMLVCMAIGFIDLVTGRGVYKKTYQWIRRNDALFSRSLLLGLILGWIYKICTMQGWL